MATVKHQFKPLQSKLQTRMKPMRYHAILPVFAFFCCALSAQSYALPPVKMPDEATLKAIASKITLLGDTLEALRRKGVRDPYLADAQIYHKAATWIKRHNEFYQAQAGAWTL